MLPQRGLRAGLASRLSVPDPFSHPSPGATRPLQMGLQKPLSPIGAIGGAAQLRAPGLSASLAARLGQPNTGATGTFEPLSMPLNKVRGFDLEGGGNANPGSVSLWSADDQCVYHAETEILRLPGKKKHHTDPRPRGRQPDVFHPRAGRWVKTWGTARQDLLEEMKGCLLIGHGIWADLRDMDIQHPAHMIRDTMDYPGFQRRNKQGYTVPLGLAEAVLKIRKKFIQRDKHHDSREDAKENVLVYLDIRERWEPLLASA
ncbi:hypothetical protein WJX73_001109 [Symbiochloris irregularis]|uniref:Exonuclease domain-containing protein n=1 Tax=Symbiochloris irregularis TaxID=706552 RepID=A0AAW1NHY3_9CHLO